MNKRRRTSIVALTLAQEMAVAVDADVDHRDGLISAALAVGEWLADQGRPGQWDKVDAAAVLRMMCLADEAEASAFLLALAGLVGFAGFQEYLPASDARRVLLQIEDVSLNPAVRTFAAETAARLGETPQSSTVRERSARG